MKNELTDRQQEILTFLEQFQNESGYPPTLRQIGAHFGISSTFGVKRHLEALVKKGYISVENNASRGISLKRQDDASDIYVKIPVIGRVAAGSPITAIENREGELLIGSASFRKAGESFALKVKGDSMIEAGILDGDMVIVSPTAEVSNNEIVVAMIDGDATVKTFYKKDNCIILKPENSKYQPIIVDETKDFKIVGKVVGVQRWFN